MKQNNMDEEPKQIAQESLVGELQDQQIREKRNLRILVWVLLFLLASGGVGVWYYLYQKSIQDSLPLIINRNPGGNTTFTEGNNFAPPQAVSSEDAYENQQCKNRLDPIVSKSGIVEWVTPQKLDFHLFPEYVANATSSQYQDVSYKVGIIKTGKYEGGDFIVTQVIPEGSSVGERYRIIKKDNKYYHLGKYSNTLPDPKLDIKFAAQLIEDKTFNLPDLNFPEKLNLEDPKASFTYAPSMGFFQNGAEFFCADHREKVFTDPQVGDVYTDSLLAQSTDNNYYPRQGFYIKGGDGSERVYTLDVPIIGKDNIPLITWTNGKQNLDEYSYQTVGVCGASNFRDVVEVSEADLVQIGTVFGGQLIYGYSNNNNQILKDLYEQAYFSEDIIKPSYTGFIASRPLFFWKDAFDKLIRFKNKKYLPLVECDGVLR